MKEHEGVSRVKPFAMLGALGARIAASARRRARSAPAVAAVAAVLVALALAAGPGARSAGAQVDPVPKIRASVEAWLGGRYKVDEIRRTPLPGIYEVRLGSDLIYVDDKGQYAFIEGNLVEMRSNRNLTHDRMDEIMAIDFRELPLDLAIKQVNGSGKRVFAVFEDPNCGYCKTLRRDLAKLDNATIYTFTYPILAADSELKARKAMCAPDKARAWNDMMLNNKVPDNPGTCDSPVAKVFALGQRLKVSATPTIFFSNGKRLQGYMPGPQFEKMLEQNSKAG